jgi:hypothetical protein
MVWKEKALEKRRLSQLGSSDTLTWTRGLGPTGVESTISSCYFFERQRCVRSQLMRSMGTCWNKGPATEPRATINATSRLKSG